MYRVKAIIIGSGVAGLASAIRLAVNGFEVKVYEKNDNPGGKLSSFEMNGFHFDTGPSLFTQPGILEELFEFADEDISDYISYQPIPVAGKYFYEDGTVINAYTDTHQFAGELSAKTGEDKMHVLSYLKQSASLYNNIGSVFLNNSLHKPALLVKAGIGKALAAVRLKYLFKAMHAVNAASFTREHTVQLFDRYATYNGSSPYEAPAMLCLIPHLEYNQGVFYPKGGMISITNALYRLAIQKGVEFFFNTKVERINCDNKTARSISINNGEIAADIIVSNMDVYGTYKFLLNDDDKAAKILKQERSSSAIVFYWGIKREFAALQLHNIFFSKNYKEEFDCIFKKKMLYEDPTVYINITSKCEAGVQAPAGKENWFVMVNAPCGTKHYNKEVIRQCRKNVINKLNRMLKTDIEPMIEVEDTLDPVSIENNTASFMGSLYGTSSNSRMAAFLRQPNFSKKIKGLYFAGGSVHPGGGIPLCLKSAKIMSEIAVRDITNGSHRSGTGNCSYICFI